MRGELQRAHRRGDQAGGERHDPRTARAPRCGALAAHADQRRFGQLVRRGGVEVAVDRRRDRGREVRRQRLAERGGLLRRELDEVAGERRHEHRRGPGSRQLGEGVGDERRADEVDPQHRLAVGHARREADDVRERADRPRPFGGRREPPHRVGLHHVAGDAVDLVALGPQRGHLTLEVLAVPIGQQHPVRVAEAPGDRHRHSPGTDDDRQRQAGTVVRGCGGVAHHAPTATSAARSRGGESGFALFIERAPRDRGGDNLASVVETREHGLEPSAGGERDRPARVGAADTLGRMARAASCCRPTR